MSGLCDSLSLTEDGTIKLEENIKNLIFHQNLNVFLVITEDNVVKVFDPHSSLKLSDVNLTDYACRDKTLKCMYLGDSGRILFCGGKNIGLRQDHQGVLLLNTILQNQVSSSSESIVLELLLSEALQLHQCLVDAKSISTIDHGIEFKEAIEKAITETKLQACSNPKVGKWRTVCITLPINVLLNSCSSIRTELQQHSNYVPALSLASALCYRLNHLSQSGPIDTFENEKEAMFSEAARLATFSKWPHMNYKWALPDQMAQAGFFHQPQSRGDDDRAMCFICDVCLVYWEPTDEPWSEHERHSPNCPYVKGEYTHNVPLSVTHSTSPALSHSDKEEHIDVMSNSNCRSFIATATKNGSIVVWNLDKELKKEASFIVDPSLSVILDKHFSDTIGYTDMPLQPTLCKMAWEESITTENISQDSSSINDKEDDKKAERHSSVTSLKSEEDEEKSDSEILEAIVANNLTSEIKSKQFLLKSITNDLFAPPRPSHDVKISSMCVFSDPNERSLGKSQTRSCLAVGVGLRRYNLLENPNDGLVQVLNNVNQSTYKETEVLDIMKLKNSNPDETPTNEDPLANNITSSTNTDTSSVDKPPPYSNFVPYLLIYDLSPLISVSPLPNKTNQKLVYTGTSKKSTRKAAGSYSYVKKGEVLFEDIIMGKQKNEIHYGDAGKSKKDAENKSASKKMPKCIQCVTLPQEISKRKHCFQVDSLIFSLCGQYLLITLRNKDNKPSDCGIYAAYIMFKVKSTEDFLGLEEEPIATQLISDLSLVPKQIVMVPTIKYDRVSSNFAGCICEDGSLRILSLSTLEYVKHMPSETTPFNDLVYCHSLERLCVSQIDGKVSLIQVKEDLNDRINSDLMDGGIGKMGEMSKSNSFASNQIPDDELLSKSAITEENLDKCIQLTNFQLGCPRFVATVPPCWSEIIQAQKQRRNPQHLQHQSEDVDTTRTWKLETDGSLPDEHIFDVLLPLGGGPLGNAIQIGHIDVKFYFQVDSKHPLPKIQVTLLKQNLKNHKSIPTKLENYLEFPENPVVTADFLLTHKAEILCGPITINNHMDLSGQAANITLTSAALLACKGRSFLIHIKVLGNKDRSNEDTEILQQYVPPQAIPTNERIPPGKKKEALKGCDLIKELSLTIHCCTKTSIPQEKFQRLSLIESTSFHEKLLKAVADPSKSDYTKHRALDLFLWILSIQTASQGMRFLPNSTIDILKNEIHALIYSCILKGDRSFAHKVTKIIITVMESMLQSEDKRVFECAVLEALLQMIDSIATCESAGAVFWFFSLLNHVKWSDQYKTASKITKLLSKTSQIVYDKLNPLHAFLQTKFALYGSPLEKELFDIAPPILSKQTNIPPPSHQNSMVHHHHQHQTTSNGICVPQINASLNKFDCLNLFFHTNNKGPNSNSPLGRVESGDLRFILGQNGFNLGMAAHVGGLCGLFEVEPLHFTLHMASDGTKMERVYPGQGGGLNFNSTPLVEPTFSNSANSNLNFVDIADYSKMSYAEYKVFTSESNATALPKFIKKHRTSGATVETNEATKAVFKSLQTLKNLTSNKLPPAIEEKIIMLSTAPMKFIEKAEETKESETALEIKNNISSSTTSSPTSSSSSSTTTTTTPDTPQKESLGTSPGGPSYQQTFSLPPQQMIVIERMHSGARRFVVLDFGSPVVLTDVIIPACNDLVSLTIDIWLTGEESDGERLAVASDIGVRPLLLADLQPPPLCRYLKVTTLGRYGMVTALCRIPIGAFYGHSVILPWHVQPHQNQVTTLNKKTAKTQLSLMSCMVEDIGCRYSLACSKLRSLLLPLSKIQSIPEENIEQQPMMNTKKNPPSELALKIKQAYQDCQKEQHHLNLVLSLVKRLQKYVSGGNSSSAESPNTQRSDSQKKLEELTNCSSDKLTTLLQHLLNCLLTLSLPPSRKTLSPVLTDWCDHHQARALIEQVCIRGPRSAQASVVSLLARLCANQNWWGEFIASNIATLFTSGNCQQIPATRIFTLLTFLGEKSVQCGNGKSVIDSVVCSLIVELHKGGLLEAEDAINESTASIIENDNDDDLFRSQPPIDPQLVSWLLLFLSLCLDCLNKNKEQGLWSWVTAESCMQKRGSEACKGLPKASRERLKTRLVHHKQQLINLETATKSFGDALANLGVTHPNVIKQSEILAFKKIQKQHAMKHFKDLCSIHRNESNSLNRVCRAQNSSSSQSSLTTSKNVIKEDRSESDGSITCERSMARVAIKGLVNHLMNTNFPCTVDLFLLTCKVIGGLVKISRPCLKVSEILNEEQLESLLCQSMSLDGQWGSPWAQHAITCLLLEVVEGERMYGTIIGSNEDKGATYQSMLKTAAALSSQSKNNNKPDSVLISDSVGSGQTQSSSQSSSGSSTLDSPQESATIIINDSSLSSENKENKNILIMNGPEYLNNVEEILANGNNVHHHHMMHHNQSATSLSPPMVNVATSHFTPIEEEDDSGKFSFMDYQHSSDSDEMIEFLTDTHGDMMSEDWFHLMHNPWTTMDKSGEEQIVKGSSNGSISSNGGANGSPPIPMKIKVGGDHSTVVDARLENGISLTAQLRIHMMNAIHSSRLNAAVTSPPNMVNKCSSRRSECYGEGDLKASINIISTVIEKILGQLSLKNNGSYYLENLLNLWMTLNIDMAGGEYMSSIMPDIPLKPAALSSLLLTLRNSPTVSIRCWSLTLQTLTLCCNLNQPEEEILQQNFFDLSYMAYKIISDKNFIPVFYKFLSENLESSSKNDVVGNTFTSLFEDLLLRLEVRCNVIDLSSESGNLLKMSLLKLLMKLLEPDAAFALGLGPLDAQRSLLRVMLSLHYDGLQNTPIHLTIINSIVNIVHGYLSSTDDSSKNSVENGNSTLNGIFASVLRPELNQGPLPSRKVLLCSLLNLARKLIHLPLEPQRNAPAVISDLVDTNPQTEATTSYLTDSIKLEQQQMYDQSSIPLNNSSQTDEHKAMNNNPREILAPFYVPTYNDAETSENNYTSQECAHNQQDKTVCIADSVIHNEQTMQLLLYSLGKSEGNSVAMILLGIVKGDVYEKLGGSGETLTDALYQLLISLNNKSTQPAMLVKVIISYITTSNCWNPIPLSEPILYFITQVLDCQMMINDFASRNGMELMWENFVKSVNILGGGKTSIISDVMNQLAPSLPPSTILSTSVNKRVDPTSSIDCSTKGLYNFAPLATVTSSNPTARPADALVRSTQFFPRTKSPPWSYHFYPDENSVDLILTLPCPILLHQVHMQPHSMSLGIVCPSKVSIETGTEGGSLTPVVGLLSTAGLACVKIVLPHPVVASVVVVRLYKPCDQPTLGLSNLKLLGTTTFNHIQNMPQENEYGSFKSSNWWLRLISHCLKVHQECEDLVAKAGSRVNKVVESCVTLLLTGSSWQSNTGGSSPLLLSSDHRLQILSNNGSSNLLENITLALVKESPRLLRLLVKCLFNHPLLLQPQGSLDAAVSLIYTVSLSEGGMKLMLHWLSNVVNQQLNGDSNGVLINAHVLHCLAASLWNYSGDLTSFINEQLFKKLYDWSKKCFSEEVKESVDHILGSMCKIEPSLFTQLLVYMSVLTPIGGATSASLTDDRKDSEAEMNMSRTDDMKEGMDVSSEEERYLIQEPSDIQFTSGDLQTLALAAQSPPAIKRMLDSGLPFLLVQGILAWCKEELVSQVENCSTDNMSESATDIEKATMAEKEEPAVNVTTTKCSSPCFSTEMVAQTLETLTALVSEPLMKEWLGSGDGSMFWISLLPVLGDPVICDGELSIRMNCSSNKKYGDYSRVEDATIALMRECCQNHPNNQKMLACTLCHLIQRQNPPPPGGLTYLHSLSGFTRRLVLQILLETERVLVHVKSPVSKLPPASTNLPLLSRHPKYGTGRGSTLLYLPVNTTVEDLFLMFADWKQGPAAPSNSHPVNDMHDTMMSDMLEDGFKKELGEVGLELVDKLSVAAGVTAKDKRSKDKPSKGHKRNSKKNCLLGESKTAMSSTMGLTNKYILGGNTCLPGSLTLSQVMTAQAKQMENGSSVLDLEFDLVYRNHNDKDNSGEKLVLSFIDPLPSTLEVFTNLGGLGILAQHMTLLYPDTTMQQQFFSCNTSKTASDDKLAEKMMDEDLMGFNFDNMSNYSNMPDFMPMSHMIGPPPPMMRPSSSTANVFGVTPIPPHALGAFTLFLRLPGYAETLFIDTPKACSLLKLALGVNDGLFEGSLATLPFQVLEVLLRETPLTTDDGVLLRNMCLSTGALNLILACLAALSHQDSPEIISSLKHPNVPVALVVGTARVSCSEQREHSPSQRNDSDRCNYWAKGTGFGTGSTNQTWNIDQAMIKQKVEEQHVVWLIRLLAQFINPGDNLPADIQELCREELEKVRKLKKIDVPCNKQQQQTMENNSCSPSSCCSNSSCTSCSSSQQNKTDDALLENHSGEEEEILLPKSPLPEQVFELFLNSGLMSKITSYLSNDSVLDMSRHVPLYKAIMFLVRGIAINPSLVSLLTLSEQRTSISTMLTKMKNTVNTYMAKLNWTKHSMSNSSLSNRKSSKYPDKNSNSQRSKLHHYHYAKLYALKNTNIPSESTSTSSSTSLVNEINSLVSKSKDPKSSMSSTTGQESEEEGLNLLVPDIQLSTKVVEIVSHRLKIQESKEKADNAVASNSNPQRSLTDIYLDIMKPLQFDSYEMIVEDSEKGIRFVVPYHYENLVRSSGDDSSRRRTKRLAQEAVTLSSSLPLSYSSSVFVRADTDRLDVMKVLIMGPEDTPYANGCFEFDVYFPNNYPFSPLYINLQTTGERRVRFNPNLYHDGKVCLSILNTWHGRPEEKWNPQTSSLLQVLVSIQSLILVSEPYFNEPGYERSRGSQTALHNSQEYDASIRSATVRWAILNQLKNPSPCFKDIIDRHFYLKQNDILAQVQGWITEMEALTETRRVGRVLPQHVVAIKKFHNILKDELCKMRVPKGLEDVKIVAITNNEWGDSASGVTPPPTSSSSNKNRTRKISRFDLLEDKISPEDQEEIEVVNQMMDYLYISKVAEDANGEMDVPVNYQFTDMELKDDSEGTVCQSVDSMLDSGLGLSSSNDAANSFPKKIP